MPSAVSAFTDKLEVKTRDKKREGVQAGELNCEKLVLARANNREPVP